MIKTFEELETIDYTQTELDVCLDSEIVCEAIVKIIKNKFPELNVKNICCYAFRNYTKEQILNSQTPEYYKNNYSMFRDKSYVLKKQIRGYEKPHVLIKIGSEEIAFWIEEGKDRQVLSCVFSDNGKQIKNVKTLKMTDDKVTLNLPWIISQAELKKTKAEDTVGDKKVDVFRKQLIQTWMLDKLIEECGIPSSWITMTSNEYRTYFIIKYLNTKHQQINLELDKNYKQEEFELRTWKICLGKQHLNKKLSYAQVVSILKPLKESGCIFNSDT